MSKLYKGLCLMCAIALTGCNVSNRMSNVDTPRKTKKTISYQYGKAEGETAALASWWSYLGDETLDGLVRSSLNLYAQNGALINKATGTDGTVKELAARLTGSKPALAQDIVKLYLQYRSLQGQDAALNEFIEQRKLLAHKLNGQDGAAEQALKSDIENEILKAEQTIFKNDAEADRISGIIAEKTGLLPEYINQVLRDQKPLPFGDITPVLGTSAKAFAVAPQMQAFQSLYRQSQPLGGVLPKMMIGEFFGVSGEVYVDQNSSWQVKAGTFAHNLDLSHIPQNEEGEEFQDNIASSLFIFQGNLIHYSELGTQYKALNEAFIKTNEEHELLKDKYMHDISFMTAVMDKQKDLYDAKMASLKAQYERLKVLVDVYAYFGAY